MSELDVFLVDEPFLEVHQSWCPKIPELGPYNVVDKPIQSQPIMELAHKVAGCNYENQTKWGYEVSLLLY